MAKLARNPRSDETIDSPSSLESLSLESALDQASARRQVALVEGSTPQLSHETRSLLRDRLRLLAIMLFLLFAAFLVRSLFSLQEYVYGIHAPVFYAHVAVTFVLALMAQRLCTHCDVFEKHLRLSELLIIGSPAAFFLLMNYHRLFISATLGEGHAHLPSIVAGWILLIMCYAMFVPNTWQRAAVILSLLGIAPTAIWLLAWYRVPEVGQLLQTK
ncbi:MAG: hypothetical protein ACR2NM_00675, partial [Bythopirellula sp.]